VGAPAFMTPGAAGGAAGATTTAAASGFDGIETAPVPDFFSSCVLCATRHGTAGLPMTLMTQYGDETTWKHFSGQKKPNVFSANLIVYPTKE